MTTDPLAAPRPCDPPTTHRYRRVGESDILCCVRCGQGKYDGPHSPTPPAIDAERLARALDRTEKGIAARYPLATEVSRRKAAAIIAAYEADTDA